MLEHSPTPTEAIDFYDALSITFKSSQGHQGSDRVLRMIVDGGGTIVLMASS
jgi:hypothetical protein